MPPAPSPVSFPVVLGFSQKSFHKSYVPEILSVCVFQRLSYLHTDDCTDAHDTCSCWEIVPKEEPYLWRSTFFVSKVMADLDFPMVSRAILFL